jgi:hypothetical protein
LHLRTRTNYKKNRPKSESNHIQNNLKQDCKVCKKNNKIKLYSKHGMIGGKKKTMLKQKILCKINVEHIENKGVN